MTTSERPPIPRSYFFFNLGCPKNLVDAERAAARLERSGWRGVDDPREAALLVVTTCAFIERAVEESIEEILRVAAAKREGQQLAVLGCLVTREGDELRRLLPEVDHFLGIEGMIDLVGVAGRGRAASGAPAAGPVHGGVRRLFTPGHLAYLKIADGCSNHCSYCTIPSIRGELRCTDADTIVAEARQLAAAGVRELTVVAQDTGAWREIEGKGGGLPRLLRRISTAAHGAWLRLMYLHPAHTDPAAVASLVREGVILPYLDLPIQHASDRVLGMMRRGYARADLERLLDRLRCEIDGLVLRTTVMVGFPGETDGDFRELLDLVERTRFDHVGAFAYSPERGTEAASLPGAIDGEVVAERLDELLDLQMDISQELLAERIGTDVTVLVDGPLEGEARPAPDVWGIGRYYGQAYEIDGITYLAGERCEVGDMCEARVLEAGAYDIFARSHRLFN